MFNVEIGETVVKFLAEQGGKAETLTHYLRQPNANEWKQYQIEKAGEVRITNGSEGFTTKPGAAISAARLNLYDKIATKAEGYCKADGKPIDCAKAGWRDSIPPDHKLAAIARWDQAERITFEDEDEKNL